MLIITKNKTQRREEDRQYYSMELTKKMNSKLLARTGRPGEKEEYPDPGPAYWKLANDLARNTI